jgi:hypothetical protein
MIFKQIMKDLLYYFLPLAVPSTIALITSEKIRAKKKVILLGNLSLLVFVTAFSLISLPNKTPLQAEWAFYVLKDKHDNSYELRSLLGEGTPTFLGLENQHGEVKGVPVVYSGEQSQIRIRLNHKGYVYVFHFDTYFRKVRQLFPSDDVHLSNPVISNSWIALPSSVKTWRFDQKTGIEGFLVYISSNEPSDIKLTINNLAETVIKEGGGEALILRRLQQKLRALAPCNLTGNGELEHNLNGVIPRDTETHIYKAQDGKSAIIIQFLRHES